MISFEKLNLADRQKFYDCFNRAGRQSCVYSFANLYLWGMQRVAEVEGRISAFSHFNGHTMYLFPVGPTPLKPAVDALRQDAKERGIPFRLTGLTTADCRELESCYPGEFEFRADRNSFEYIYDIDHLADLKGRGYQSKRNHIKRFLEFCPNWHWESITPEKLKACRGLLDEWFLLRKRESPYTDYCLEKKALERAISSYEELGLEGILLYGQDDPIAMSIGSRLSDHIFDIHFEKAFGTIPGDYTMVNQTFSSLIRQWHPEICYLNREDDMGIPGLRTAKESYHPTLLLEQYWCALREELDET